MNKGKRRKAYRLGSREAMRLGGREAGRLGGPKIQLIELNMFIGENRLKEK